MPDQNFSSTTDNSSFSNQPMTSQSSGNDEAVNNQFNNQSIAGARDNQPDLNTGLPDRKTSSLDQPTVSLSQEIDKNSPDSQSFPGPVSGQRPFYPSSIPTQPNNNPIGGVKPSRSLGAQSQSMVSSYQNQRPEEEITSSSPNYSTQPASSHLANMAAAKSENQNFSRPPIKKISPKVNYIKPISQESDNFNKQGRGFNTYQPAEPAVAGGESNVYQTPVAVSGKVSVEPVAKSGSGFKGFLKLLILILLPIAMAVGGSFTAARYFSENTYAQEKGVLVAIPMQNTNWQDLGVIFEPLVDLPVKTTSGYEKNQFLLDSGAVISSLPREWADKSGQDLAFLPRSTFRGFGGKTSFAYQGEMMVLLGETEIHLPVVFTESGGTKSLLGRKGFFENFSIYFNHKEKRIEIRE